MRMLVVVDRSGAEVGSINPARVQRVRPVLSGAIIDLCEWGEVLVAESARDARIAIDGALRGEERQVTEAGDD